jgi:hypothetical protein
MKHVSFRGRWLCYLNGANHRQIWILSGGSKIDLSLLFRNASYNLGIITYLMIQIAEKIITDGNLALLSWEEAINLNRFNNHQ